MLKKMVVGEAVLPQLGDFNSLDQGAGVFAAFDLKGQFREAPSPLSGLALPLQQLSLHCFSQQIGLVLARLQSRSDASERARRQRGNDLIRVAHLTAHPRARNAYEISRQATHISHMPY